MIKFTAHMCVFAGESPKGLPEWFQHGTGAEITFAQLQELFDLKINTQIRHLDDGSIFLLVDTRNFSQR